ncbi:phosphatase PAP2 family protein [Phaeocystidibacter luteus]|uniref:Phosphatase PAP2 family protein n=1 Tax=Phaeocystidibacter luteus TaxID=911197 RepID=A0A6N6RF33_9FLAO|nr:phosphatase PAP2 family protein [Phaeocystidibacter luteus]KAB2809760.1 phosphatase PAP2 family protein [Phaeocystidibacter luteus]
MNFCSLKLGMAILSLLSAFVSSGQIVDTSYWQGWYETPADVVRVDKWNETGWWTAAGVMSTGLVIYSQDAQIRQSFQSWRTDGSDQFSRYVAEPIGSGLYSLGGTAIAFGVGYFTDDAKLQRTSLQAFKAFVLTGGATVLLKQLTHRPRPYESDDPYTWLGPYAITGDNDAFPSGHTSTAFAVASVFAHSYREQPWVGVSVYSLATLAGLSRIHDDVHWGSDVFFGAALGWYVGRTIVQNDRKLWVLPTGNGVYLSYSFD